MRGHEGSGTTEPLLGGSPTETSELAAEIQDAISEGAISFLLTEVPPRPSLSLRFPLDDLRPCAPAASLHAK